eukprot:INCI5877.1.p1 GENE.INCI5877.1~~INCI5877.1.p1  ORF type:complete len:684 (-),score=103.70 INCI5877.1:2365-4416(-)
MTTKRVVRKAQSRLGVRGLDEAAVPFAKPTVNLSHRISRAAIGRDVSPVLARDGVLLKKAPVGRKVRYFNTNNHFLNYWESKMDMLCAPEKPYGSINLLKVYRIAQSGRKLVLSFAEQYGLKPVNLKAPTAAAAKKWAKNISSRRRHFETVCEEALRAFSEKQRRISGDGTTESPSLHASVFRKPVDARSNLAIPQEHTNEQSRMHKPAGAGSSVSRRWSAISGASSATPHHTATPTENGSRCSSDSESNDDGDSPYISVSSRGQDHRNEGPTAPPKVGQSGQSLRNPPKQLPRSRGPSLASLPLGSRSSFSTQASTAEDDEWAVPGPPPSPGPVQAMSDKVRHASVLSARRRRSRSMQSASSPSPRLVPPPPEDDDGFAYQPPPVSISNPRETQAARGARASSKNSDFDVPESSDEEESVVGSDSDSEGERQGDDWKKSVDPETGKTFWYNQKTRCSQWERPLARTLEVAEQKRRQERRERKERRQKRQQLRQQQELLRSVLSTRSGKDGEESGQLQTNAGGIAGGNSRSAVAALWEKHVDPDSGQPFWFNRLTKESTWDDPHKNVPAISPVRRKSSSAASPSLEFATGQGLSPAARSPRVIGTLSTRSRSPAARKLRADSVKQKLHRSTGGDVGKHPKTATTPRQGWREQVDPATGDKFYFHKRTRKSTWTQPDFWAALPK